MEVFLRLVVEVVVVCGRRKSGMRGRRGFIYISKTHLDRNMALVDVCTICTIELNSSDIAK